MSEVNFDAASEAAKHHGWMEAILAALRASQELAAAEKSSESPEYRRGRCDGIQEYFDVLYALGKKQAGA